MQRLYRFLAPKNVDAAKRAVKAIREGVNDSSVVSPAWGGRLGTWSRMCREWMIDFGDSGYIALYR